MSAPPTEAGSAERPLSAPDRLALLFETLGLDRTALVASPDSTLRPGELAQRAGVGAAVDPGATVRGGGQRGPATSTEPFLPTITLGERPGAEGGAATGTDLLLGEVLGEGGMGVVHGATQRSLGRMVAVKRPLGEGTGGALVAEARTMALVEHPNVVPVYALGRDASEQPVLVMKRIAGASLKELLRDRSHAAWPRLEARWGDQERACLGILGEVCDALTLAHSLGVVHRDVKPENVMVGEFGEVYLLDWGIACRVGEGASSSIVGTPGFMAPEMVLDADRVDARTDVYLLGATLHNVLTGRLRHSGESFFETLASVLASEPAVYAPEIPEDLAALANAATSLDRAARPASASAFRRALADHERHREAKGLLHGAREALRSARASGLGTPEAASLLGEAGLSVSAARRALPGFEAVATAHRDHLVALVERDLALESPQAARAHLARLDPPGPKLEARVVALERKLASARASEQALLAARAEADTRGSFRVRLAISVLAGAAFAALVVLRATYLPSANQARSILENDLMLLGLLVAGAVIWRKKLLANAGNRQLTALTLGQVVALTLANAASYVLQIPSQQGVVYTNLVVAVWWASAAVGMHRAYVVPALTALAGSIALAALPQLAGTIVIVSILAVITAGIGSVLYVIRHSAG